MPKATWVGAGVGGLLALALLIAPPMGTDLSAQVARADFVRRYGITTPVDLRWYGGTIQYGYSWLSPLIMSVLGAPLAGAAAVVASTLALSVLLTRCGACRPITGTVLGAIAFAGNLVSGRTTYALGVAFGLWALAALTLPPIRGRAWPRLALAAAGAVVASAISPPAGLFLGLAGGAIAGGQLVIRAWPRGDSILTGCVVGAAAGFPLGATALLASEPGVMNISTSDATHAIVTGLVTAALVPVPVLRLGGLLSSLMVLAVYVVPSPVGLNATRLAIMFVLPVVAGFGQAPTWMTRGLSATWRPGGDRHRLAGIGVLMAVTLWQPPLLMKDLTDAGNPTADREYFAPLLAELKDRQPVGRIEIPPTRDYWESAYVADVAPLARGWLRQVDITRNALFFPRDSGHSADSGEEKTLDPGDYYTWLIDNGVSYVALPDARPSWVGWREVDLIMTRPPYLQEVWRGEHWVLFAVAGSPSVVDGATLVSSTPAAVTFDTEGPGEVLVRVTPSRWSRVRAVTPKSAASGLGVAGPGGLCAPPRWSSTGRWMTVRVACAGRYAVTS